MANLNGTIIKALSTRRKAGLDGCSPPRIDIGHFPRTDDVHAENPGLSGGRGVGGAAQSGGALWAEHGGPDPRRNSLALSRDPLHGEARQLWNSLRIAGARLHTSIPVVIETFTFLERNANRDVALAWKDSVYAPGLARILPCELRDLEQSWAYFRRRDFHKLSAVDATSSAIMRRADIRVAYAFDHRFAVTGFRPVG